MPKGYQKVDVVGKWEIQTMPQAAEKIRTWGLHEPCPQAHYHLLALSLLLSFLFSFGWFFHVHLDYLWWANFHRECLLSLNPWSHADDHGAVGGLWHHVVFIWHTRAGNRWTPVDGRGRRNWTRGGATGSRSGWLNERVKQVMTVFEMLVKCGLRKVLCKPYETTVNTSSVAPL